MSCLSEAVGDFMFNKNMPFVSARIAFGVLSCLRVLLVRLNPNYDYMCTKLNKCQDYPFILHHHYNEWNGYFDDNSLFLAAFFLYISFAAIRLFICFAIGINDRRTRLILEPIKFCERNNCNLTMIGQWPNVEFTRKLLHRLPLGYAIVVVVFDVLLNFAFTKNVTLRDVYFVIFTMYDAYYIIKLPLCYLITIQFVCSMFNVKLDCLFKIGGTFEFRLRNAVQVLNDLRRYNRAFRLLIGSLLISIQIQLAEVIYVTLVYRKSIFSILYAFNALAHGYFLYYCIRILSLINIRFVNFVTHLEKLYKSESVNFSTSQKFKFNYVLNNCKFNNSFTVLDIDCVSTDYFRKVTLWIAINIIRLAANNLKL